MSKLGAAYVFPQMEIYVREIYKYVHKKRGWPTSARVAILGTDVVAYRHLE